MPQPSPIPTPFPVTGARTNRRQPGTSLVQPKSSSRQAKPKPTSSMAYDHPSSDSSASSGSDSEEEYRPPLTDECLRAEFFLPGMMDSLTAYCTSRGGPKAPSAKLQEGKRSEAHGERRQRRHRWAGQPPLTDLQAGGRTARGGSDDEGLEGDAWHEDDEHLAFLRQQAGMEHGGGRVVELVPRAGDEVIGQRVGKRKRQSQEDDDGCREGQRDNKRLRDDGNAVDGDELSYSSFLLAASTSFLVEPVEAAPLPDFSVADTGRLHQCSHLQDLGAPWMIIDSLPVSIVSDNLNPCPICLAPLSHPPFDYSAPTSQSRRRPPANPFTTAGDSSDSDDDQVKVLTPGHVATATAECITLPCMHLIHAPCARQSLVANRKCPECRCDVVDAVKHAGAGGSRDLID
ncbi:hypothetical protein BCR44DRAFT_43207 [Catenaria anguillulae PL171]|uniref:RING-type domain-containing protein n=1 Tax=Catenaria anguillulae PL171 TaxID=765915 RepID=A0A1Y2HAU8_9FUNG|nr:hypothetical protein BCR44DRAFT_43207 [Catenaria anguillulae PL171]